MTKGGKADTSSLSPKPKSSCSADEDKTIRPKKSASPVVAAAGGGSASSASRKITSKSPTAKPNKKNLIENKNSTSGTTTTTTSLGRRGDDSYPVLPDLSSSDLTTKGRNMIGLHTEQSSIILGEMISTRRKLEEDNQQLRDDLVDARLSIQLLKLRIDELEQQRQQQQQHKQPPSWSSQDDDENLPNMVGALVHPIGGSTEPPTSRFLKALEWAQKKRANKKRRSYYRNAFKNPSPPGKKTFASTPATTLAGNSHNYKKKSATIAAADNHHVGNKNNSTNSPSQKEVLLKVPTNRGWIPAVTTSPQQPHRPKPAAVDDSGNEYKKRKEHRQDHNSSHDQETIRHPHYQHSPVVRRFIPAPIPEGEIMMEIDSSTNASSPSSSHFNNHNHEKTNTSSSKSRNHQLNAESAHAKGYVPTSPIGRLVSPSSLPNTPTTTITDERSN